MGYGVFLLSGGKGISFERWCDDRIFPIYTVWVHRVSLLDSVEEEDEDHEKADTEVEISLGQLPQAIKDNIATQFPGTELVEAEKVTAKDGSFTFVVEIKHNGKASEIKYKAEGLFTQPLV